MTFFTAQLFLGDLLISRSRSG